MDKTEAVAILKRYKKLLSKHLAFDEMILFGPYAKGNQEKDSDVDVAISLRRLKVIFLPPLDLCYGSFGGR